jgi:hypothetical protein
MWMWRPPASRRVNLNENLQASLLDVYVASFGPGARPPFLFHLGLPEPV